MLISQSSNYNQLLLSLIILLGNVEAVADPNQMLSMLASLATSVQLLTATLSLQVSYNYYHV